MDVKLVSDIVDYGILGLLAFMGFLVIFFWIERLLYYKKVKIEDYTTQEALELDLAKHVPIISSFGANAPYIGLLGTVLGIIVTFYSIGQGDNLDAKVIMTSLALALKATAMGLIVAIPAIFFNNHLNVKIDTIITKWKILQKG
ncbi:MAG: TonB-system energizer ExbB [Campylobacterota bacterium]|nr:TonB-system energizer ExbB [Campylobacterota bacterium]